jgi:2-methylcitrate dehydratase
MDVTVDRICTFLDNISFEHIPADAIAGAKSALIDSLGCALGGHAEAPVKIALQLAQSVVPAPGAASSRVLVSGQATTPEWAGFVNTAMIRSLDYNDTFHGPGAGGHGSDYIGALLAAADGTAADGKKVLTAIVAVYEIFCRLLETTELGSGRWDHVTSGTIATAGAVAKMLGLRGTDLKNAVCLAVVPNLSLQVTRLGAVSLWKCAAVANAARNGIFAVQLAAAGMTGPPEPFSGRGGLFEPDAEPLGGLGDESPERYAILRSQFKRYPVGSLSQTAATAAAELYSSGLDVDEIQSIELKTHARAISIMAGDNEKWNPLDRETADHSLPYVIAITLLRGAPDVSQLTSGAFRAPYVLNLMKRITVAEDDECRAAYPPATLAKIRLIMRDGSSREARAQYHRGHYLNPMTRAELEQKYMNQATPVLGDDKAARLLSVALNLEEYDTVRPLLSSATVQ